MKCVSVRSRSLGAGTRQSTYHPKSEEQGRAVYDPHSAFQHGISDFVSRRSGFGGVWLAP